ncbi:MAG: hypothetical protein K2M04_05905 [Muribaculaceae bacterium]|nr:hypothetical protein [Muribaculaceae bacterium]
MPYLEILYKITNFRGESSKCEGNNWRKLGELKLRFMCTVTSKGAEGAKDFIVRSEELGIRSRNMIIISGVDKTEAPEVCGRERRGGEGLTQRRKGRRVFLREE